MARPRSYHESLLPSSEAMAKKAAEDNARRRNDKRKKEYLSALKHINNRRNILGEKRLDPEASGWNYNDVISHARDDLGWKP